MLLAEDPATVCRPAARGEGDERGKLTPSIIQLINQTINSFNINPDKLAISRIGESVSTLEQARDLRIRESEDALKRGFSGIHAVPSPFHT